MGLNPNVPMNLIFDDLIQDPFTSLSPKPAPSVTSYLVDNGYPDSGHFG